MEIIDIIQFVLIALLGFCFYALRNRLNAMELLVKLLLETLERIENSWKQTL